VGFTFIGDIRVGFLLSAACWGTIWLGQMTKLIGQLPVILLLMKKRNNLALGVMLAMSATALLWGICVFFART